MNRKKLSPFGFRAFTAFLLSALLIMTVPREELFAQAAAESSDPLSLRRVSLFSSGVAYFEHSGRITGPAELKLPFSIEAVNDALKSLTVSVSPPAASPDSSTVNAALSPSIRYTGADILSRTSQNLSIDLSGNPGIAEILSGLQGAWIELAAPNPIRGRILSVETPRTHPGRDLPPSPPGTGSPPETRTATDTLLSLYTEGGIRLIALRDISSFSFTDPRLNADIKRALDLIGSARDSFIRELLVSLPGSGEQFVSLSYVIPAPVWKVSYRLDLSGKEPFLQGWAIADNNSNTDWQDVELSLLTGRPVSFIQALYPPYNPVRPVLPLAIAGVAEARTWDSGYGAVTENMTVQKAADDAYAVPAPAPRFREEKSTGGAELPQYAPRPAPAGILQGGTVEGARTETPGDQFEFTFRQPVTLHRGESIMLPLFEGAIAAERSLVFSGSEAAAGSSRHPAISAELTNTTGMKLPAGPVTVYDGGVYAGDALLTFLPDKEKRIISYGDDLSVTGWVNAANHRISGGVTVSRGVMTISRRIRYEKTYTFRNASGEAKRLILEHPVSPGAVLTEPASFAERTGTVYRFVQTLPADRELTLRVREERPVDEGIILSRLGHEAFAAYISNEEIPLPVRNALQRAADLKRQADDAGEAEEALEARRTRLVADQDRIRRNLEAAGNQSPQGQEYLRRLVSLDAEIDTLSTETEAAAKNTRDARLAYESCLASLEL
ncbi:MAG: DUF4139 domain-containing protein [Spirochaetaceae bacterium]|jgi:hypothetical protein|nr:DUF4139 domain-containing protein [Spirochaetaceae bacterium]